MRSERQVSVAELRARLWEVLSEHVGRENAIGMGELYEAVYGEKWRHRINDTRALRYLITDLREQGKPICSVALRDGGGYYIPAVGSERRAYIERLKRQGLRKLRRAAIIEKRSLPELLGQMALNLKEGSDDAA